MYTEPYKYEYARSYALKYTMQYLRVMGTLVVHSVSFRNPQDQGPRNHKVYQNYKLI